MSTKQTVYVIATLKTRTLIGVLAGFEKTMNEVGIDLEVQADRDEIFKSLVHGAERSIALQEHNLHLPVFTTPPTNREEFENAAVHPPVRGDESDGIQNKISIIGKSNTGKSTLIALLVTLLNKDGSGWVGAEPVIRQLGDEKLHITREEKIIDTLKSLSERIEIRLLVRLMPYSTKLSDLFEAPFSEA